jgi:hypothetical protein
MPVKPILIGLFICPGVGAVALLDPNPSHQPRLPGEEGQSRIEKGEWRIEKGEWRVEN